MYYEINVLKNKTHFFATAPRSLTTERDFKEALKIFNDKFPKEEGYSLSATYERCSGKVLDVENLLEEIKQPMMLVYDDSGVQVQVGDVVPDHKGMLVKVQHFAKPHKSSSQGKVTIVDANYPEKMGGEYYVGCINATWVNRDD